MKRTIRESWRAFVAIIGLIVVAGAVGGYILSNQRFYLPNWVPVVGSDFVDYEVELGTAQSVTPGQGQTVQIAGIDVGDITSVRLKDGVAIVGVKLRRKYTPIRRDATALLRPKTGLNDMVVALDPGTDAAPAAPEGWRIPLSQTQPNVNPDEVLASLDADTRSYLKLLLGATGEALGGNGKAVSNTLRRFEPLSRDVARLTGALAERRGSIRRSIHNFRLLSEALGEKDDDLAGLVDASARVFTAIERQDTRLREALQELPPTLRTTRTTLAKVDGLATELGDATQALRPTARALGPALRDTRPFLRDTVPIIRKQLRPFARQVKPVIDELRPGARDLAVVTPKLTESLGVVNTLLNTLAYNPPGREEGYLFWASWTNQLGASLFNSADAHGPIRRGLVVASCASLGILSTIGQVNPQLGTLATLLNPPKDSCPQTSQANDGALPGTGTAPPTPTGPTTVLPPTPLTPAPAGAP